MLNSQRKQCNINLLSTYQNLKNRGAVCNSNLEYNHLLNALLENNLPGIRGICAKHFFMIPHNASFHDHWKDLENLALSVIHNRLPNFVAGKSEFFTYIYPHIMRAVRRYVAEHAGPYSVAYDKAEKIGSFRMRQQNAELRSRKPLDLTKKDLRLVVDFLSRTHVSLDEPSDSHQEESASLGACVNHHEIEMTTANLDTLIDAGSQHEKRERVKALYAAIEELDSMERQVIELSFGLYGDALSDPKIANQLGMTVKAARAAKASALCKLRGQLSDIS